MIELENQHWIPRFLLRNFADKDGKIFRLNVADDKVTKPPPKFAASRPNFNELIVRGEPQSFEQDFERLETSAAPVIAEILKSRSLQAIDSRQRTHLSKFVAAQTFRTEAYRLGLASSNQRHEIGTVFDLLMSDLGALAGLIARRRWALMVTLDDQPFYLGDNPVVLQSTVRPGNAGKIGLDMAGIETMMPLSPQCALFMPCPTTTREIIAGYQNGLRIVSANLAGIELSDFDISSALPVARRALKSAEALYRALMYGEALEASEENVENLNYLQCAWASSAIYSSQADFSFALRVFQENPSYRETIPVTLAKVWPRASPEQ